MKKVWNMKYALYHDIQQQQQPHKIKGSILK